MPHSACKGVSEMAGLSMPLPQGKPRMGPVLYVYLFSAPLDSPRGLGMW